MQMQQVVELAGVSSSSLLTKQLMPSQHGRCRLWARDKRPRLLSPRPGVVRRPRKNMLCTMHVGGASCVLTKSVAALYGSAKWHDA